MLKSNKVYDKQLLGSDPCMILIVTATPRTNFYWSLHAVSES